MDIKVYPGRLCGTVKAPPSKSMAHRALICAALAEGTSLVKGISLSKDMEATMGCMSALGATFERTGDGSDVRVTGLVRGKTVAGAELDCIESGSTIRFILPVAGALGAEATFTGRGKLPERPMTPLADQMKLNGVTFSPDGRDSLPFTISGQLRPGKYVIPGNISSQYISGLLFALPLLEGDSEIHITGDLESASYINLTLQMIADFDIKVEKTDYGFSVSGGQTYRAREIEVEGDYSNAAFFMAANATGSELEITGLRADSAQGDRRAAAILAGGRFNEKEVDSRDIPDIVPILSVAAVNAPQTTRFYDAGRLRIKESDRLAAMADCLTRLGADVKELEDELIVYGGEKRMKGGCEVSGYNDHRIVMSMAIAALSCSQPVIIKGAEAVAKSFPDFFDVFRSLGGRAEEI